MNEPKSKTWKTWTPDFREPSWVKEQFVAQPAAPSPGWAWELPDESDDWSSRWYRTPEKIVDEYEVEVQNPESLVALGKELRARPWNEPGFVPHGTGRPLNRAGRRAQRRGKR